MLINRVFFEILALKFLIFTFSISAFNIDTYAPILKNGPKESYFGYQVTFHINEIGETLILVGAPKDNLTNYNPKVSPGSVYKCNYDSYSYCQQIDLERALAGLNVEGIWLGGAIESKVTQGGKAVICAHRFKKDDWGEGQCFIMDSDLNYEDFSSPCGGDREKEKGHEQFGFCQAGVSVGISKNDDLLIGLPGAYTWKGALAKRMVVDSLESDDAEYLSKVVEDAATKPFSYLGMSVASGYLMADPNQMTFVGGAPRSQEVGEVIFFTKPKDSALTDAKDLETRVYITGDQFGASFGFSLAVLDVNADGLDDLVVGAPFYRDKWLGGAVYVYLNVAGKGITARTKPQKITPKLLSKSECFKVKCINSQFGHTLAHIGDINLDGFQDLAIGAPYEGRGVVYIYKGGVEGLTLTQRIQQASFPVTFGTSIHGGGIDLDNNGYPDVIVGAYQSAQVVILRSRPILEAQHILQSMPSIIDPSTTSCPSDNHPLNCIVLRICFVLLQPKVDSQKNKVQLSYKLEAELFTGSDISRVVFKDNKSPGELTGTMMTSLVKKCQTHRVYIRDKIRDFLNPIPVRLTYHLHNLNHPSQSPGEAIPSLDEYPVMDDAASNETIMIHFKKNCGDDSVCKSNLKLQASLGLPRNPDGVYRLRVGMDKEVTMDIEVDNVEEDAHESTLYINLTSNIGFKGLNNKDGEIVCDVTQRPIPCNLGNPLKGKGKQQFGIRLNTEKATSSKEVVSIKLFVNTTSEEVDEEDNRVDLKLEIKVETDLAIRGSSDPAAVFYSGEVRGESVVVEEEDIGPEVKHSYEIKNIGNATVERSKVTIWWPHELHSTHPHGKHLLYLMDPPLIEGDAVCTYDPTIINPLSLKVDYSKRLQTKDRFNIRALEARQQINNNNPDNDNDGGGDDDTNGGGGNDNDGDDDDVVRRVRRFVEAKTGAISLTDSFSYVKKLDCDDGSAKCHVIHCDLEDLRQGQSIVIRIRSRLWNSTFLQEFKKYDKVDVFSKAQVSIDPSLNIQQTHTHNDILKIMTSVQPEFKETKDVAWWVVLLAVLVGLLLLVALILLLWKCGFFKRNRGSHMTSHKAEMLKKEYDDE